MFTGKERDAKSGLDYFGARYHASTMGRFISPDPGNAGAEEDDPQSWNGYAYAGNNPLRFTDPDGMNYKVCDNEGKNCADLTDKQFEQYLKENEKVSVTASGTLEITLPDGAKQKIGSATYYNEKIPQMFEQVERMAGLPVRATAAVTLTFVQMAGPGLLSASRAAPQITTLNLTKGTVELTRHALQRSIQRGISQGEIDRAVESAQQAGRVTQQIGKFGTPQLVHEGSNGVTVVVETAGRNAGKAVTVFRAGGEVSMSERRIRQLLNQEDVEGLLSLGAPTDEYETEAQMINHALEELRRTEGREPVPEDVLAVIRRVWGEMFTLDATELDKRTAAFIRIAKAISSA